MKRIQVFILGAGLLAVIFAIVACSQEMSDAEIRAAAEEMGMMAAMTDADIMTQAGEMGMMTQEEVDAMMMAGNPGFSRSRTVAR